MINFSKFMELREATKKKQEKKFTTVVNYGGVSKFWCVNLKKVLFLELIFQKNMLKLIHNVPFVCLYKIQSLNSYKIMWETGMLVPFGMARGGRPSQNSNLNSTVTNFWPNRKFENSTRQNFSTAISNFGPERWKLFIICLFRAWL